MIIINWEHMVQAKEQKYFLLTEVYFLTFVFLFIFLFTESMLVTYIQWPY